MSAAKAKAAATSTNGRESEMAQENPFEPGDLGLLDLNTLADMPPAPSSDILGDYKPYVFMVQEVVGDRVLGHTIPGKGSNQWLKAAYLTKLSPERRKQA